MRGRFEEEEKEWYGEVAAPQPRRKRGLFTAHDSCHELHAARSGCVVLCECTMISSHNSNSMVLRAPVTARRRATRDRIFNLTSCCHSCKSIIINVKNDKMYRTD